MQLGSLEVLPAEFGKRPRPQAHHVIFTHMLKHSHGIKDHAPPEQACP